MRENVRWMTEVALLAASLSVAGAFKLPGLLPGTEFQLSAPLAVAICAVFGFAKYITAGLLSSMAGLMLGTQSVWNVGIALIFRCVVGAIFVLGGNRWLTVVLAGPIATITSRLVVGGILGNMAIPFMLAAVPGIIYTAITVWPLTILLKRITERGKKAIVYVVQR